MGKGFENLRQNLSVLTDHCIEVPSVNVEELPCVETSALNRLCRAPVVSVHMITFNHEQHIGKAIEGVMMQKTDFEFELVIGEDCSQDKTREICFEYQKKYPDKIRVLWWHENVNNLGGNAPRTLIRCRGKYIAFCEGDDFWTDPLKLQKQVDVFRQNPNVAICFGGVDYNYVMGKRISRYKLGEKEVKGLIKGIDFARQQLLGESINGKTINGQNLQTSGVMVDGEIYKYLYLNDEIGKWKLLLGDKTLRFWMVSKGDAYIIPEAMSQYQIHSGGVTSRRFNDVMRDDLTVRLYFSVKLLGMSFDDAVRAQEKSVVRMVVNDAIAKPGKACAQYIRDRMKSDPLIKEFFSRFYARIVYWPIWIGIRNQRFVFWLNRIYWHLPRFGVFK